MDIILIESVAGLGRPGDQVKVKPGYARNYLLPYGKAVPVSADVFRNLGKLKARALEEERAMISTMEELKAKLDEAAVEISARATDEGHLFGSVSEKDIQEALEREAWSIPPRSVRLEQHLKEAGDFEADVHLYGEITARIKVTVVPVDAEGNRVETPDPEEERAREEGGDGEDALSEEETAATSAESDPD